MHLHLASEPEIQENVYDELLRVFGDTDEKWTYDSDSLAQLHYLDSCIREGLRLFPPFFLLARNTGSNSYKFDGDSCQLPSHTEFLICTYSIHHNETIYPEPDKFDPDRWSPSRVHLIPKNCWIPFGSGPRHCIGYRFAMIEMKIIIATILKQFRLQVDRHYSSIDWTSMITTKPVEPCKFKLSLRS